MRDPRLYQIAVLSGLLAYGLAVLGFDVGPAQIALTIGAALSTQALASRAAGLPRVDLRSALISALSLCLLLRTGQPILGGVAAVVAVGSKFVIRSDGKHVFNPTNLALVAMLLSTDRVWVSSGQWGSAAFFGFLMAGLGTVVVSRARRADVTFAFLLSWAALLIGRSAMLGEPLAIPFHRLQSGALLLFAFFMISDPKTTPDARAGRLLFAALVAAGAWFVQFRLFVPNALLWSLFAVSPTTPLIDRLLRAERYAWPKTLDFSPWRWTMKRALVLIAALLAGSILTAPPASAFCGFFVSKADAKLFNKASRVVMVRDGNRTVLTMAADYKGDPKEFALVIPVPTPIVRGQIHVGATALVDHIDAFTAPRLVEYFDEDPCAVARFAKDKLMQSLGYMAPAPASRSRAKALGVTIEARFTVGEYDILILSATQSGGLATWLVENGYKMPKGAENVLGSYIRQGMRFFVARVNLEEKSRGGWQDLRPIQIAYESPKFMLPLRLGMLNAHGAQEMFVYAITRSGRVEATNYRTVKIASGDEIPAFVKDDFAHFYRDMFARQAARTGSAVFVEYAWDMGWCDPCASDPLGAGELRDLGVFWLPEGESVQNTYVTRLHVRYDRAGFPEDLAFQATPNKENFQGRYVLRHPWTGTAACDAAIGYRKDLLKRLQDQASALASLTGWDREGILARMDLASLQSQVSTDGQPWWSGIWGQQPK